VHLTQTTLCLLGSSALTTFIVSLVSVSLRKAVQRLSRQTASCEVDSLHATHFRLLIFHIFQGFKWDSLPEGAVVVDVGGGIGSSSMVVAKANPKLKIINQDRAPVIEHAKAVSLLLNF
jgi:O-methyltransferase domain